MWLWFALGAAFGAPSLTAEDDPYRWLEEIDSERALSWVHAQNAATAERLTARADYHALYRDALAALDAASRLPEVEAHGGYLYNFWQDAEHPRGVYRRTTADQLRRAEPEWEIVLDIDELAAHEGVPWAFGGAVWRKPDEQRCLIRLSPGGGDAQEYREFDAREKAFVEGGFVLPVAKSNVAWCDADSLYVATDFGPGSLTQAGYPRIVKRWRRHTPLAAAELLHEAPATATYVRAQRFGSGAEAIHLLTVAETFWTAARYLIKEGDLVPLPIPRTARVVDAWRGQLVLWLREDWQRGDTRHPAGTVIVAPPAALLHDSGVLQEVVRDSDRVVVSAIEVAGDDLLIAMLDHVSARLDRFSYDGSAWQRQIMALPTPGSLEIRSVEERTGAAWIVHESFTTPPTLFRLAADATQPEQVKAEAPTFAGERFTARQFWCTSADGAEVPYFVVGPKELATDGRYPVWMFSYGGFENALTPSYSGSYEALHGAYGKLWLERGGVFVLANIRGGGEFGPRWHRAALKEHRHRAFEDFEAVARDLVRRGITRSERIGIEGRSNGGLLVAATMLRHPELYGAVVCGNPLLDMLSYHRLLAGASWMAEYGNPEVPAERDYLSTYSPYQNVRAGVELPPIMFYTTTRDDRVHPGHARKMAAKMQALGHEVYYYENTEGGHHGSVTSEQLATRVARTFAFLWEQLGD